MPNYISNTSCLIVLSNIGLLDILQKMYGQITICQEVAEEFGEELPNWIKIRKWFCMEILLSH